MEPDTWLLGGTRCTGWAILTDVVQVRCELRRKHKGKCDAPWYRGRAIAKIKGHNT